MSDAEIRLPEERSVAGEVFVDERVEEDDYDEVEYMPPRPVGTSSQSSSTYSTCSGIDV